MIRRSVFIQGVLAFLVLYTLYSAGFIVVEVSRSYSKMYEQSTRVANNYLKIGSVLLKHGEVTDLADRLEAAMAAHEIDYYFIRENGQDVVFASAAGADDPILFAEFGESTEVETEEYRNFIVNEGPYYLAIGHKKSLANYVRHFIEANKTLVFNDILFVSLITFGMMLFAFRDLREVLRRLRKRSFNRGDLSVAKSSETLTLVQGLVGYQSNVEALTKENALLKGQILPALRKEITSGRPVPYEFGCTLVRTDINNFTTIFTTHDRAQFMATINSFFIGVTHIVSRYRGFVYEFIGDEVIYYFKDEDTSNSVATAMAALRDINHLADKMSEETENLGYAFKIKSSLAWGTLRFGPLVNGFSLAGKPLIETVRLLTHVHEKSENTILFEEGLSDRMAFLALSRELGVVMLKGLSNTRKLRVHEAYIPLSHHLRQGTDEHFSHATYYRSDENICEVLNFVRTNLGKFDSSTMLKLLGHFRSYRVTEFSVEIRKSFIDCAETLIEACERSEWQTDADVFLLATLIASAGELFPEGNLTGRLRETLLRCLEVPDRRVVANALDVFGALDADSGDQVFEALANHRDNRIVANALIKQAKKEWSKTIAKRVNALLRMQSAYYKSSGLYALGEIAAHLKALDEVSFRADLSLQDTLESASAFLSHANKMVRRQALKVYVKTGRFAELAALASDEKLAVDVRSEIKMFLSETQPKNQVAA